MHRTYAMFRGVGQSENALAAGYQKALEFAAFLGGYQRSVLRQAQDRLSAISQTVMPGARRAQGL
jgi:hypothetical protein